MWRCAAIRVILPALALMQAGTAIAVGTPRPATIGAEHADAGTLQPAPGTFLVAKRALEDPGFGRSVVYLAAHDASGSLGLIVNRRSQLGLAETVPDLDNARGTDYRLYFGGPVELTMVLMLARGEPPTQGLLPVADGVSISSERQVMEAALAEENSTQQLRFYLGYSGWAGGQLDFELAHGSWHVLAADPDAIFSADSAGLWERLIERLEPAGIQVEREADAPWLVSNLRTP